MRVQTVGALGVGRPGGFTQQNERKERDDRRRRFRIQVPSALPPAYGGEDQTAGLVRHRVQHDVVQRRERPRSRIRGRRGRKRHGVASSRPR